MIPLTRRKYRSVLFFSIFSLSLSATLLSSLPSAQYLPPTQYSHGFIDAGFPRTLSHTQTYAYLANPKTKEQLWLDTVSPCSFVYFVYIKVISVEHSG